MSLSKYCFKNVCLSRHVFAIQSAVPRARKVIFLSYLFCTQHQHIQVQGAGSHLSVQIGSLFLSDFICTASICTALIGLSPLSWISLMRTHHLVVHLRSRSLTSIGRRRRSHVSGRPTMALLRVFYGPGQVVLPEGHCRQLFLLQIETEVVTTIVTVFSSIWVITRCQFS